MCAIWRGSRHDDGGGGDGNAKRRRPIPERDPIIHNLPRIHSPLPPPPLIGTRTRTGSCKLHRRRKAPQLLWVAGEHEQTRQSDGRGQQDHPLRGQIGHLTLSVLPVSQMKQTTSAPFLLRACALPPISAVSPSAGGVLPVIFRRGRQESGAEDLLSAPLRARKMSRDIPRNPATEPASDTARFSVGAARERGEGGGRSMIKWPPEGARQRLSKQSFLPSFLLSFGARAAEILIVVVLASDAGGHFKRRWGNYA